MKAICPVIIEEHQRLWMIRNKSSGLTQSLESFKSLQVQIDDALALLDKNGVSRWANRTTEKMKSAATVLYLK